MGHRTSLVQTAGCFWLIGFLILPGCASRTVNLVDPQSGATAECSGSGYSLGAALLQGHIDDCVQRSEARGYVTVDKLTPEQRADLEKRGLLPK
jgi:hypothetical protein